MKKALGAACVAIALTLTGCSSPSSKTAEDVTETNITTRTARVTESSASTESATTSEAMTEPSTLTPTSSRAAAGQVEGDEESEAANEEPEETFTDEDLDSEESASGEEPEKATDSGASCYEENGYVFISKTTGANGMSAQVTTGDSPRVENLGATTKGGSVAYDASVGNGDVTVTKDGSTYRFVGKSFLAGEGGGNKAFDFTVTCP